MNGTGTRHGRWIVRLALACYLAVGVFPYLASGLLVPPAAVAVLMAFWAVGLWSSARWAERQPMVAPAAVVVAIVFWFAFVSLGAELFNWTA